MSKTEEVMDRLFVAIGDKNVKQAREIVDGELAQMVIDDRETINWIAQPVNLTKLHNELMEHLGIPRKMLMLRNRVPSTHRRSVMFVKAISNALKRLDAE